MPFPRPKMHCCADTHTMYVPRAFQYFYWGWGQHLSTRVLKASCKADSNNTDDTYPPTPSSSLQLSKKTTTLSTYPPKLLVPSRFKIHSIEFTKPHTRWRCNWNPAAHRNSYEEVGHQTESRRTPKHQRSNPQLSITSVTTGNGYFPVC